MVVCFSDLPEGWGKITALIACIMNLKRESSTFYEKKSMVNVTFMTQCRKRMYFKYGIFTYF